MNPHCDLPWSLQPDAPWGLPWLPSSQIWRCSWSSKPSILERFDNDNVAPIFCLWFRWLEETS